MKFDFDRFISIVKQVYPGKEGGYDLNAALSVFQYYFQKYEECMGKPHPPIRASQIISIIQDMPWVYLEDRENGNEDIAPEAYKAMIDRHFETQYRNCNYNINHFFSGRIRELRYLETCY